jgi:hypothetical protein
MCSNPQTYRAQPWKLDCDTADGTSKFTHIEEIIEQIAVPQQKWNLPPHNKMDNPW